MADNRPIDRLIKEKFIRVPATVCENYVHFQKCNFIAEMFNRLVASTELSVPPIKFFPKSFSFYAIRNLCLLIFLSFRLTYNYWLRFTSIRDRIRSLTAREAVSLRIVAIIGCVQFFFFSFFLFVCLLERIDPFVRLIKWMGVSGCRRTQKRLHRIQRNHFL